MGFFSALFGRDTNALLAAPRLQHYGFAHVALREVFQKDPLVVLSVVADPASRETLLNQIFDDVTARARELGEPTPMERPEFSAVCGNFDGLFCSILIMPTARAVAECHLVGMVVPEAHARIVAAVPEDAPPSNADVISARYFTLELGVSEGNVTRTVLCEWRGDSHANYGDGPKNDPHAFIAAIHEVMAGTR